MQTDVLIIGGGLAGLRLAHLLARAGRSFCLVEARDRLGGRILTETIGGGHFDMGPAWFWPGQPRIAELIDDFGLTQFDQHYLGDLLYEDERGQVQRGRSHASMQGSFRMSGGLGALINALADRLSPDGVLLNTQVTQLQQTADGIIATTITGDPISAQHVVLAIPPRIAATLFFNPMLPDAATQTMQDTATWMAGQAKAIAVYDRAFWRKEGLSGDAMSRTGPMVEIHDASPAEGGPYALFGFIGVPPQGRENEQVLRQHLQAQLIRLFGPKAAYPKALFVKDWAFDPQTSTPRDLQPLYAHPSYGLPDVLTNLWGGRIIFGGTEVAPQFGGYLEGALEAAENAFHRLHS